MIARTMGILPTRVMDGTMPNSHKTLRTTTKMAKAARSPTATFHAVRRKNLSILAIVTEKPVPPIPLVTTAYQELPPPRQVTRAVEAHG